MLDNNTTQVLVLLITTAGTVLVAYFKTKSGNGKRKEAP